MMKAMSILRFESGPVHCLQLHFECVLVDVETNNMNNDLEVNILCDAGACQYT